MITPTNKMILLTLAGLSLMSCQSAETQVVSIPPNVTEPQVAKKVNKRTEKLYRVQRLSDHISVDVITTGCTKVDDFIFSTKLIKKHSYELLVIRRAPDNCRASPNIKTIIITLPTFLQDKNTAIHIANPLSY